MRKALSVLTLAVAVSSLFATDISLEGTVTIPQPGKDVWVTTIGGVDYAFVNAGREGVRKIRISDRTEVATFIPPCGAVRDIWVKDTLIFVANHGCADTILYILDSNLNPIGKLTRTGSTHYFGEAITVSPDTQNVVFIAVQKGSEDMYLFVVDAKNPTNPRLTNCDEEAVTHGFWTTAIYMGKVSVLDLAVVNIEKKPVGGNAILSECWDVDFDPWEEEFKYTRWMTCDPDTVDVFFIAALLSDSDSSFINIYAYDYFHVDARRPEQWGSCPSNGCGGGVYAAPFGYKCYSSTGYSPHTDTLQDHYAFSTTSAYQMWAGSHAGTKYAFVARGTEGLWIFPLYPSLGVSNDIGDPIISGYKASDADDYRDVYIYGDLIFLANYGQAPGEKLCSVLNAAALEDSILEETASYNEYFGEGIWGDSLRVYVVGDSL